MEGGGEARRHVDVLTRSARAMRAVSPLKLTGSYLESVPPRDYRRALLAEAARLLILLCVLLGDPRRVLLAEAVRQSLISILAARLAGACQAIVGRVPNLPDLERRVPNLAILERRGSRVAGACQLPPHVADAREIGLGSAKTELGGVVFAH